MLIYVSSPSGVDIVAFSDQTVYQAMLPYKQGVIYGCCVSYSEDTDTLLDGGGLLHELGNAGHDGRAVVAGPVAEDALHLESIAISLFVDIFVEFDKYRI